MRWGKLILVIPAVLLLGIAAQRYAARLPEQLRSGLEAAGRVDMDSVQHVYTDEVRLERHPDGHFYAEILVNRTPVKVIVDTGATALVLRERDAESAGIHTLPADFTQPVRTANGTAMIARMRAREVELGPLDVHDVTVGVARDEDLWHSLLGMEVLSRLGRVQFDRTELVIERPRDSG